MFTLNETVSPEKKIMIILYFLCTVSVAKVKHKGSHRFSAKRRKTKKNHVQNYMFGNNVSPFQSQMLGESQFGYNPYNFNRQPFSNRQRNKRTKAFNLGSKAFGDDFDEDLMKVLSPNYNKGKTEDVESFIKNNMYLSGPNSNYLFDKMNQKERKYNAIINAVNTILRLNGIYYVEDESPMKKDIMNLIDQLINPEV
ncbi:hypothetical protein TRFO_20692 [Tritrichomonas foetus]|uniref:Uncharacterized protein n=1 Tax=Tritrichomonas foetus TaxID=1144522 RepID=A0A1J4KFC9_9EUKA|nr:hypothetical protein TRFO_20692 [Tritrichomonas foetus]|eukprot:OHT10143.1 hypothetical protein TRFO_20692 [Tritrichomonas foetus]